MGEKNHKCNSQRCVSPVTGTWNVTTPKVLLDVSVSPFPARRATMQGSWCPPSLHHSVLTLIQVEPGLMGSGQVTVGLFLLVKKQVVGLAWEHKPLIPALERQRQVSL